VPIGHRLKRLVSTGDDLSPVGLSFSINRFCDTGLTTERPDIGLWQMVVAGQGHGGNGGGALMDTSAFSWLRHALFTIDACSQYVAADEIMDNAPENTRLCDLYAARHYLPFGICEWRMHLLCL
jgi:hypothetical protein